MTRTRIPGAHAAAGFVALSCVGFITTLPTEAAAQDTADQPTRLEGVRVTDTAIENDYGADRIQSPKATAPLLDTPRTINVITSDVLRDSASFEFADALRTVPGITLGAGEGGVANADIPVIRGIDATADTYVDGLRDVGSQTRETFAVERIEVFKGSNSAFGGRGSAAGAINIVSKLPQDDDFATAEATIGTDDFKRVTADVNRKLSDRLAVRMNALWHDADVPGRDAVFNKRWGVAPSVTWGIGTDTHATFSYYHYETNDMPDYGIPLTSRDQLPGGVRRPADTDYDNFYGLTNRDFQETNVDAVTFLFSHDFGSGWVLSDTARWSQARNNYIVTNPDDSHRPGNVVRGIVWRNTKSRDSRNDNLANSLNLSGKFKTGKLEHSLATGFEFSAADTTRFAYAVATGDGNCPTLTDFNCTTLADPDPSDPWTGSIALDPATRTRTSVEEYSFYAFDTVTIVPQFLLNGGVRWTSVDVHGLGVRNGNRYDVARQDKFWSWQGGVVFKPVENASLYFSYADSTQAPGSDVGEGSNGITDLSVIYEPSKFENFEVGGKVDLFDGSLSLSAAAFQIDRTNVRDINPDTGSSGIVTPKARIKGFELGASGRVGPVSLLAGYSYTDSEIRGGADVTDAGNSLPNAPKHNFALTSTVDVTRRFSIGGGAYHASMRYADTANLISAEGYWAFDANASFRINDHFSARLNIRNLTDKRYITKIRSHFAVPSDGRQALFTISASY